MRLESGTPRGPGRGIARVAMLAVLAGVLPAAAQRATEFPETVFGRPPAPTTAMVHGRPVPLSPTYDGLVVTSTLQTGESLYMLAQSVLADGTPLMHLIAIRPSAAMAGGRAAATTRLAGQPIEVGSVLRKEAGEFTIAGPTRSFRRDRMQWVPYGADPDTVKPPRDTPDAVRKKAFRDDRAVWWVVDGPLGETADSIRHASEGMDIIGFTELGTTSKFYLPPNPGQELFARLRPKAAKAGNGETLSANVGPVHRIGQKAWFGITFYDSEGASGVGGVGVFDLDTRTFDMRWGAGHPGLSVSRIHVHRDDIWVALMGLVEYADYSAGAAHYSISRNASTPLDIPGDISAIVHFGPGIGTIFASSEGLFRVVGTGVIPLPIEWER